MSGNPSSHGWCERLYGEQGAGLVLYGRALGLSHAEAEDVLQDVFDQWLSYWKARPPSPRLKARLFHDTGCAAPTAGEDPGGRLLGWLVPLTACLTVALLAGQARQPSGLSNPRRGAMSHLTLAAFSNQFYAAYLPPTGHSEINAARAAEMGWTSPGQSTSSMGLLPSMATNQLEW
ncbi:MAG: hypothetical protein FJ387_02825 [Verrucomicrobia bacterium]|nr:hypothetical protein [Verrucomicrobiota bacterium]